MQFLKYSGGNSVGLAERYCPIKIPGNSQNAQINTLIFFLFGHCVNFCAIVTFCVILGGTLGDPGQAYLKKIGVTKKNSGGEKNRSH